MLWLWGGRVHWRMNHPYTPGQVPAFTQWDRLVNTEYWGGGAKPSTARVIRVVCTALCCRDPAGY
eukprot:3937339-Rhodomonas_salina.2